MNKPARHIMIGGFLGAGKSTAMIRLGHWLGEKGLDVGLITNDQSTHLVDTQLMRSQGFAVEEIAGGCFCCKFDSLMEAAQRLEVHNRPQVFLAEPVGSCTDLVATVAYPLRRIYGDRFSIAPLSVLVDPVRASRLFGLIEGKSFSPKVSYIYRKQLEEAELIVINKLDAVEPELVDALRDKLAEAYPRAEVLAVSCRRGDGLDEWFNRVAEGEASREPSMTIDYDTYAEGEAMLGWLNATLWLEADAPIDGETLMMDLAERMRLSLSDASAEIAHLKMTLLADSMPGQFASLSLVRGDYVPELTQSLPERMRSGRLIVNLRSEAKPSLLIDVLQSGVSDELNRREGVSLAIEHEEHFEPGRPEPTWRMPDADALTRFAP